MTGSGSASGGAASSEKRLWGRRVNDGWCLVAPWGPSWGPDDTIVYGQGSEGIWRIPASGGAPENIIKVDEGQLAYGPQTLPGGRMVLFTLAQGVEWDDAQIVVESLDTGARHVLVRGGTDARYVQTGHLVYASRGSLLAVPFDPATLKITGGPEPLAEDVAQSNLGRTGAAHFGVSTDALVYVPGSALAPQPLRTLVWVDRRGREEPVNAPPRWYAYPRVSPDGTRVALQIEGTGGTDIQILDLGQGTLTRLIPDVRSNFVPIWTADGSRVIFSSSGIGRMDDRRNQLVWRAADGTGTIERLTSVPGSVSDRDLPRRLTHDRARGERGVNEGSTCSPLTVPASCSRSSPQGKQRRRLSQRSLARVRVK